MSYKLKGSETVLPLAVESIQDWITEKEKFFHQSYHTTGIISQRDTDQFISDLKVSLYRDVLITIKNGAAHGSDLAEAALKLEDIFHKEKGGI